MTATPLAPTPPFTLAQLNAASAQDFVAALGGVYEHSPWVAEAVLGERPFASVAALAAALQAAVLRQPFARQLALLCAHPELASKAAVRQELTAHSNAEQAGAGLTQCSAEEFAELQRLNAAYRDRFGWPFIIAVKGHTRASILAALQARLQHSAASEFEECIAQVGKIAALRLDGLVAGAM